MISELFLQELKSYSDIEQVVSSYVHLKRRGRVATGLCPFHSEKTPSFTVYPDNQSFYCFGCGAGGDVITFIRRIENLEYVEAVRFLAQRAGMAMPEDTRDDGMARLKARVLELNRTLARFYHSCLRGPQGKPGAVVVPLRGEKYLRLMHQPAERLAVEDPVAVARVGRAQRAVLDRAFASERVLGEAGVF